MALVDQYAFCPCGSGKKFKWCCQNIYNDIERAYVQLEQGQQDSALRIIDEIVAKNPGNPEVLGQKAQILLHLGKQQEAEDALQKAFDINPNYPFGLLLQARLRAEEGELTGALILARRAAEAYHPDAVDYLGQAYALIFQIEMRRRRPVAAQAALRILIRCHPADPELRLALEQSFGPESLLPACAREEYAFLSPSPTLSPERRKAWDRVLEQVESPRLLSLAAAFEQLTAEDPADAAAWFNLALVQAWLGENRKAVDALEKYLPLEEDENRATRAAALAEVLRCAEEFEAECDYRQHIVEYQVGEIEPVARLLNEWSEADRLVVLPSEERSTLSGIILDTRAPGIITAGAAPAEERRLGAYFLLMGPYLRIWSPSAEGFEHIREEVKEKTALSLREGSVRVAPPSFNDVVTDALVFPAPNTPAEAARATILENARKYFEEDWIRRPLRSLAGNTPLDAVGSPLLRKKLLGVLRFIQDCSVLSILKGYDFAAVRHKLGLEAGAAPAPAAAGATPELSALNTAELAALSPDAMSEEQLETAIRAAQKLDAGEVATRFVQALVARPVAREAGPRDRYQWFAYLVQRAINEGNTDAAMDHINEGERQDCEYNEGRRRNDYELRRAQVHVRRREADHAHDVFTRLIRRSPENLKYRGSAAEGMLSLKETDRAINFAEEGLAEARRQNDRDSEQYLMELAAAALKQAGG